MADEEWDTGAAETDTEPKKTFGQAEIVLISLVVVFTDLFTVIATLSLAIPIVGEVLVIFASFTSVIVTGGLQFYLSRKKVKNLSMLIGGIVDMIPVINALPTLTIGWVILVIVENNPRLKNVADKVDKSGVGKIAAKV